MTNHERLFTGKPYKLNDHIIIKHPTVGQILDDYGEQKYFSLVRGLTTTPSDMKSTLYDMGLDFEKTSELEAFFLISRGLKHEDISILFDGDLDLSTFDFFVNHQNDEKVLSETDGENAKEGGCIVDSYTHMLIADYLRDMHYFIKNNERAGNEGTKMILIEDEREALEMAKRKKFQSFLLPMIFAACNCADFKYDYESVRNLPIFLFMSSVGQIGSQREIQYVKQGIYSGCIDAKSISDKKLAWIQDINTK